MIIKALIVGGGIGGLCAAIALRRAGIDVTVFERAPQITDVGAGISLWANAIEALDRLGVGDAVRAASVPYEVGGLRTWDGIVLSAVSAEELIRFFRTPVIVMHRAELVDALLGSVPARNIQLGAECRSIEQDQDDGGAWAVFADGRRVSADVLIGADGLDSVVRGALHGTDEPRYAGCTAWRAVVPFDTREVRATETWGHGRIFGQVPISGNRVYWYAAMNAPAGGRSPAAKPELLDLFSGWHAPIEALIDAADDSTILRNDIFDRPVMKTWGHGRVTLLGDAAHPMTPFLGQGACQAIEDAVVLGRCLTGTADIAAALRKYEAERIPRANAFVTRSRLVGQIARLRNPLAVAVRNAVLKRVSPQAQARRIAQMIRTA